MGGARPTGDSLLSPWWPAERGLAWTLAGGVKEAAEGLLDPAWGTRPAADLVVLDWREGEAGRCCACWCRSGLGAGTDLLETWVRTRGVVVVISHLQRRERGECGCPWPAHGHGEMGAAWAGGVWQWWRWWAAALVAGCRRWRECGCGGRRLG